MTSHLKLDFESATMEITETRKGEPPVAGSATGSVSAEQWWTHHAELLAAKMKVGGVKSFRIELNARGNYEFEVVTTATPNEKLTDGSAKNI